MALDKQSQRTIIIKIATYNSKCQTEWYIYLRNVSLKLYSNPKLSNP